MAEDQVHEHPDDWWHSLDPERRRSIHRWLTRPDAGGGEVPGQLALPAGPDRPQAAVPVVAS